MELTALSLHKAARLIADRQVSPVELTRACLSQIERLEPRLNAFITVTAERALQAARRAQDELEHGQRRGPLHGIPLALKDLFETEGVATTAGSTFFRDYIPEQDGVVVARLRAAGAIFLGKLNMHEIALGVTNVNPHYGPCRNPWDTERVSGGSSGGSAVSLASEMCFGSLGSDTGGSIRIPSALCGVVGLKPTYGRISLRGVLPLSWHLDHPGPMARRVRDVALLLQAIAGYDPDDPASIDRPVNDYLANLQSGVHGWRIALASDPFFNRTTPEISDAVKAAAEVFRQLGAEVQTVEFPDGKRAARANGLLVTSDAAAVHHERMETHLAGFGQDIQERLRSGAAVTSTEYALARRTQVELRRRQERFFDGYDLLLTPTTPVPAPPISGPDAVEQARLLTSFTAPFNLSGLPAISLPCGFTPQGLPLGLQLVAPPWAEARLLQAAQAYEDATAWHTYRPALLQG